MHACADCAPGSTRPAGDDASGADTACEPTLCATNERSAGHACVACAPGSTRPGGDDATAEDSECTATRCGANERVSSHACVTCAAGGSRPAGDDATGADTACAEDPGGCGCAASPGGAAGSWLAILALALLAPRRRLAEARLRRPG